MVSSKAVAYNFKNTVYNSTSNQSTKIAMTRINVKKSRLGKGNGSSI